MTIWLKQSAVADVVLGPFLDSMDGDTQETGLTIVQADIRLSKNGGTYAQTNNVTGATHLEAGKYKIPLDTTDTDTLGRLRVDVHVTGALAAWAEFMVVPATAYDALVAGSDTLQADVTQWLGTAVTAGDIAVKTSLAKTTHITGFNDLSGAQINAEVNVALDTAIPGAPTAGSINERLKTMDDADLPGRLPGVLVGGRMDAHVGAMATDVITSTVIATDAIDAAALDATAVAEIADGVLDEAISEPSGVFAWMSATPRQILAWLGALARNKITQTSTTQTLRNDADSADLASASVSDVSGTATRGEWT